MKNVLLVRLSLEKKLAGNYGNQFVDSSELPNDGTLDDSRSQMHVQAPSVCKTNVSTLVLSFYGTPEKPAAVDCGVPLPFSTVHVETASTHAPSNDVSL
jgi:hypothetical protein